MNYFAVVAAIAFAAGAASGALVQTWRYDREIAEMKAVHATEISAAITKARQEERDAQVAADTVRSQPVRRVRCEAARPASVPGAGASPGGLDLPDRGLDRDYGPALRELVAAAIANRKLAQ